MQTDRDPSRPAHRIGSVTRRIAELRWPIVIIVIGVAAVHQAILFGLLHFFPPNSKPCATCLVQPDRRHRGSTRFAPVAADHRPTGTGRARSAQRVCRARAHPPPASDYPRGGPPRHKLLGRAGAHGHRCTHPRGLAGGNQLVGNHLRFEHRPGRPGDHLRPERAGRAVIATRGGHVLFSPTLHQLPATDRPPQRPLPSA